MISDKKFIREMPGIAIDVPGRPIVIVIVICQLETIWVLKNYANFRVLPFMCGYY